MAKQTNKDEEKQDALMPLKIEIPFCDKYTGANYEAGSVVEFEKARAKELLADTRKLVSKIK